MSNIRTSTRNVSQLIDNEFEINQPILLVEDSASLSLLLEIQISQRWNCPVHVAGSYKEAKVFLKKHRHEYHLAICDLNLPDAPNGEIVDMLKRANVPMIVVTSSKQQQFSELLSKKGIIDFIYKDSVNSFKYVIARIGRLYKNRHIKVLVVEDSVSLRNLITELLLLQNYQVFNANNGRKALDLLEQQPDIQLLLTDYRMPDMDGFELTVEVRKRYSMSQMSIIGMSVVDTDELGVEFIKNGANDFLTKPISPNQLICRITQNIEMLEHIQSLNKLAYYDHLTGTHNRRYFFNEGNKQLIKSIDKGLTYSVAMLDIDNFKKINDQHGHNCGDEVLVKFSHLLLAAFEGELVARIGGEEFAIFLMNFTEMEVKQKLDVFCQQLAKTNMTCGEKTDLNITVSIGFDYCASENLDELLKNADDYLYQAKENGRNQVVGPTVV